MFSLQSSHAERSSHQIRLHKEYTKNTCTRYWTRKTQNYSLGTVPDLQSHCGRRHIDAYDLEHPDLHFHGQADTVYVLWRRHDGIDFGSLVEDVGAKPRHIPEYPRGCAVMATSMASNPATRAFAMLACAPFCVLAPCTSNHALFPIDEAWRCSPGRLLAKLIAITAQPLGDEVIRENPARRRSEAGAQKSSAAVLVAHLSERRSTAVVRGGSEVL